MTGGIYRQASAALRQQGLFVNNKKVGHLMREQDLQPTTRPRFTASTSRHDGLIFPSVTCTCTATVPSQLWVGDITYVALPYRFAVILDAWSRRVVG